MEDESIFAALVMKGRYSLRSFLEKKQLIRRDKYFFTKKNPQPKTLLCFDVEIKTRPAI